MALVLRELYKYYKYYTIDARDTRLEHLFLMGSPFKAIAISVVYWYFVKKLGPKLMEKREPFQLKRIMIVYNLLQVIANFVLGVMILHTTIIHDNIMCILVDYSNTPIALHKAKLNYYYYLLKLSDLLDTIFFVLRKKYSQVTFLHLYHHCFMAVGTSIVANYVPAGHIGFLGMINCFVHAVMYFYYFLTCINPQLKSSIGWKKHITHLQMLQFSILIIHFGHPLLFGNCKYPRAWLLFSVIQNAFMLALFTDFYIKAYYKKSKKENIS